MDLSRAWRHFTTGRRRALRDFPPAALAAIERAIRDSEAAHTAEIRFVLEPALAMSALLAGRTPRERAHELFAALGVWDTADNNGVLIYLLYADRDLEILADRGWSAYVDAGRWRKVCALGEAAFRAGDFEGGALAMIAAVGELARQHFPLLGVARDELPDAPVVL
jgi:uncharacterized membrane protein